MLCAAYGAVYAVLASQTTATAVEGHENFSRQACVVVSLSHCWRLRCLEGCCLYRQPSTYTSSYDRVWSCRRLCGHRGCLAAQPSNGLHDRLVAIVFLIPLCTNGQSPCTLMAC